MLGKVNLLRDPNNTKVTQRRAWYICTSAVSLHSFGEELPEELELTSIYFAPGPPRSDTMNRFDTFAWILTAACTLIACGCRKQAPTVGVIPRTTGTLLWEPMHMGVAEVAQVNGLHVYWNAPDDEGDTEKQLSLISRSLNRRYQGFILAPDETLASRSLVLQAIRARRPVVIVDDELGPPPGPFLSYVSNDEVAGARLAAERIAEILHGTGSIAVIGISPRLESGILREDSFEKALSSIAPEVHIEVRRYGDSVVTHQQRIAEEILNGPRHVDAVVALTATATLGVYFAKLAADSLSTVLVVGFDQGLLLPIQSGEIDSIVVQNTRKIGQIAMHNVSAALRGEKVNGVTLVSPMLLTRETINTPGITSQWEFFRYRWSDQ
jgi:ribose transport system substrate-binding protein